MISWQRQYRANTLLTERYQPGRGVSDADLLVSDAREIPDHEAPVGAAGGQDCLMLGAPADLEHLLGVVVECVQGLAQIPQIMQRHLKSAPLPPHHHLLSQGNTGMRRIQASGSTGSNQAADACRQGLAGGLRTVLSAEPVARTNSLKGLKPRQLTSASCASTC